jgi:HD-GYP domain-containing protein (c-di-GMP phosphodiesterase class II)
VIRKIPASRLAPGMYVVDLHRDWLEHSLWRRQFPIRDRAVVQRLLDDGVTEVSIDTARGIDLPPEPPVPEQPISAPGPAVGQFLSLADRIRLGQMVSLGEERRRAARLLQEATAQVHELLVAARAGRVTELGRLEPLVGEMVESITRNPDGLVPLARLQRSGSYATRHAVASTALVVALARRQGIAHGETEKLALGTLVKDLGQASLDARLMAKPGGLSRRERSLVNSHVEEGLVVMDATRRLPETAVAVVLEHHERYDGSGYPYRLAGEGITLAGRMAAIADSFDAMTSDRPYRQALSPAWALRRLYQEGGTLFDPELVAGFIRTVGVYPVGTLVRMESGHLAVVDEIHQDDLLRPVVRVIFHAGRRQYVTPVQVDLSRKQGNHFGNILRSEEFEYWGINPLRWQPV